MARKKKNKYMEEVDIKISNKEIKQFNNINDDLDNNDVGDDCVNIDNSINDNTNEILKNNYFDKLKKINDNTINDFKIKKCKIIMAYKNNITISFNGFGIDILTKKDFKIGDIVEVQYQSEIGKSNFKCKIND